MKRRLAAVLSVAVILMVAGGVYASDFGHANTAARTIGRDSQRSRTCRAAARRTRPPNPHRRPEARSRSIRAASN